MTDEYHENLAFLREGINSRVKFGFTDIGTMITEVAEQVEDEGWEEDFDEAWIKETVTRAYEEQRAVSKGWIAPTQTDKLLRAFDQMRREKIIALHAAGYTQSDSLSDVAEIAALLRQKGISYTGHCFYHEQDMERVIGESGGELLLGFYGSDDSDQHLALHIGQKIKSLLEQEGFEVEWPEDLSRRIAIKNFRWQNVYTDEAGLKKWEDRKVVEIMSERTL